MSNNQQSSSHGAWSLVIVILLLLLCMNSCTAISVLQRIDTQLWLQNH